MKRDATFVAAALAATSSLEPRGGSGESRDGLQVSTLRLHLRHAWTTTMSSSEHRDTIEVRLTRAGTTGIGAGAPIVRYQEDAASATRALDGVSALAAAADPWHVESFLEQCFRGLAGQYAARAALDIALHDWIGQRLGVPVYRLFGLDRADAPITTFSIGIDTPELTRRKVLEAAEYPVLKVKVGLDGDEATLDAVRSVTGKPLRVDANEGWKDKETAIRKLEWLARRGVELVEQPLPAAMLEEAAWLKARSPLPLFADEACQRASDVPQLAEAFHGVNVKLDKAGGLREALRTIHVARACGLQILLGCMISSSVSTTAAAQISPLVDFADLDGHLLVSDDPWHGVRVRDGRLILSDRPGLGLAPRTAG